MKKQELSGRLRGLIVQAGRFARELGHSYVGTEHLLLALSQEAGSAGRVLRAAGLEEPCLRSMVLAGAGLGSRTLFLPQGLTPRARRAVHQAGVEASRLKTGGVTPEHLLLALTRDDGCTACRILKGSGIEPDCIFTETFGALRTPEQTQQGRQTSVRLLEQYCENMIEKAARMEPVVGRERELCEVEQILCRKNKNNPALIGEPGVGKTAIVEALAQRLASGQAPQGLVGKKLYRLDLASVLAGTKYRGEFEERIRDILAEIRRAGNMILFVDEMHTIVGAGSAEGAIDAANILKPALGRGEVQIIGATTPEEYRRHIEKDAALERRFQPVKVSEPSHEESISMLMGIRGSLERHHKVKISDAAISAAVELSTRYINDRFLPDKAIDLIDEAAARIRVSGGGLVTAEDIAEVVSVWTGIPVANLSADETKRLREMESILHRRVVGQSEAVRAVSMAIRRGRVGLSDPDRPIGSFLFLGPTGVGKTELCRALAEAVYGDTEAMIRLDMSEYMEKHAVSKLIGSPPGYVGYEDGGQLTEKVRRKPWSVVLFDEIEKAHEDVWSILLQIMDDGRLTDSTGRQVSFRNTIVVMTSNVGAKTISDGRPRLGFASSGEDGQTQLSELINDELKNTFKPEFLNRIDETIVFHRLTRAEIRCITERMLLTVAARFEALGMSLSVPEQVVDVLAERGYDEKYGARPLRRAIRSLIEDKAAELMLSGGISRGDTVRAAVEDGKIILTKSRG